MTIDRAAFEASWDYAVRTARAVRSWRKLRINWCHRLGPV
jgi:hypothetical protein